MCRGSYLCFSILARNGARGIESDIIVGFLSGAGKVMRFNHIYAGFLIFQPCLANIGHLPGPLVRVLVPTLKLQRSRGQPLCCEFPSTPEATGTAESSKVLQHLRLAVQHGETEMCSSSWP